VTEDEYQYHRQNAITVARVGECSRMKNGLIKIEGFAPMTDKDIRYRHPSIANELHRRGLISVSH